MIYNIDSTLFKRFLQLRPPPTDRVSLPSQFHDLPPEWQEALFQRMHSPEGREIWRQGQALAAGHTDMITNLSDGGGGFRVTHANINECGFCGNEAFRHVRDELIGKLLKKGGLKTCSFACSVCEDVRYCSKACQKADWPTHRLVCR